MFFLFQLNSFGLKWFGVNFHNFKFSNSAQILIFGLKYLRDHFTQNIILGAHFGQNEVLEMQLTPFLDQLSELEQKN